MEREGGRESFVIAEGEDRTGGEKRTMMRTEERERRRKMVE